MKPILSFLLLFWASTLLSGAEENRPFMWVTQSDKATVYLLGSMHAASNDLYPLDERIEKAFENSHVLAVELDPQKAQQSQMMGLLKGVYAPGDSVENHISKDLLDRTMARFQKLGTPFDLFKQFKPWTIAVTLTSLELMRQGFDPLRGIDVHFINQVNGKKNLIELESAEQQLSIFNDMSDSEQEMFLDFTEKDLDNTGKSIGEMVAAWKEGNADKLHELLSSTLKETPQFEPLFKKLFDDRNIKMAEKIEEFLKTDKVYFIVVGAGHLVGEKGLIQLLGKNHKVINISEAALPVTAP